MNSCIYTCDMAHVRLRPKKNIFSYKIFMMYLDLDELDILDKEIKLFGYNRKKIFSFYDKDHFTFLKPKSKNAEKISKENINYKPKDYEGKNTKDKIKQLVKDLKLGFEPEKVFILTNVRNYGYVFNPVSFYYCFDKKGVFRAMFSEVSNVPRDQKIYYVKIDNPKKEIFKDKQRKNFYISPFVNYNTDLHWTFNKPDKDLRMIVDSKKKDKSVLRAALSGKREEINNHSMRSLLFRYPFITFMIIIWIHIQALKLWLKKIPFLKKSRIDKEIVGDISK